MVIWHRGNLPQHNKGQIVKSPPTHVGDPDSIPGLGRSPEKGNDNLLQYSCLENTREGGAR